MKALINNDRGEKRFVNYVACSQFLMLGLVGEVSKYCYEIHENISIIKSLDSKL